MSGLRATLGRTGPAAALVGLLAIAVYANTLGHGFASDDVRVIVENPAAHDVRAWRRIFTTPSWFMEGESTTAFRPLVTWTFAASHALHDLRPFGHHLVNVLLHAGVSMLLVLLAATVGMPGPIPALAGALFAVHPIHTEVVANGVGRAELLAAVFALAALWLRRVAAARARAGPALAASVVAYGLGLLSKEHVVSLLALLPLADLLLDAGGSPRRWLGAARGPVAWYYGGLVATTAAYLALRTIALGSATGALAVGGRVGLAYNPMLAAPPLARVATALGVQARALWLLLWPVHLSADHSYREVEVAGGLGDPAVAAGVLVALGLAVAAVAAWRRDRLLCFWLALALLPWLVVSNLVIPIGTAFGERLLYLPSAGACVLGATALYALARRISPAVAWSLATAVVLGWSARTMARNPVWADDLALAEATVVDAPRSAIAHLSLGRVYMDRGRDDEALAQLATAVGILDDHPEWSERLDALYETALVRQRRGESAAAADLYREIVARDPRYFPAWVNLGALANQMGDHRQALVAAERAAAIRPELPNVEIVRGFALRGLGRRREALAAFEAVLERMPRVPDALLGAAACAFELGDPARAAGLFETLVAVAPSREAYLGLVASLRAAGRADEAERVAERARRRHPDDPAFRPGSADS